MYHRGEAPIKESGISLLLCHVEQSYQVLPPSVPDERTLYTLSEQPGVCKSLSGCFKIKYSYMTNRSI